jgi:uncharacterized secreted protein with C-terminal beta-propeller domain
MSLHPDRLDEILQSVVAEGTRRKVRRTRLVTGGGALLVAMLVLGSALAIAQQGGSKTPEVAAPGTTTTLSDGTTTTTPPATPGSSVPAAPPPPTIPGRRPLATTPLVKVGKEAQFLAQVKAEALKEVTAYGLPNAGPYGPRRGPVMDTSSQPGMGGGNAGGAPAAAPSSGGEGRTAAPATTVAPSQNAVAGDNVAGVDYSGTNNHEKGVDEADEVKTDGKTLFLSRDQKVSIVDVAGGQPNVLTSVAFPEEQITGLLLDGKRLLVFSIKFVGGGQPPQPADSGRRYVVAPHGTPQLKVRTLDVSNPSSPKVIGTSDIDGSYVDARMVGGIARLVTVSGPKLDFAQPADGSEQAQQAALDENKRRINVSTAASWLPAGGTAELTYRTQAASGLDMVSVRSIDPATSSVGPAVSVVAGAQVVYASLTSLYIATTEYDVSLAAQQGRAPAGPIRTSIHKFDIGDPKEAAYVGSGDALGTVLNQYSLSEQGDALRIATTTTPQFVGGPAPGAAAPAPAVSESAVTVFRPSGNALVEVGRVGGLGKNERIYAVRFVGDRGYVVTFRQTDPLYVIDLSNPAKPTVAGELKITGFSAYLHPLGEHEVLGIGTAANEQGQQQGFQISLFDVQDAKNPKKLSSVTVGGGSSQAAFDPHAFLWWGPAGLAVVPLQAYDGQSGQQFNGAAGFGVSTKSIVERARISHPAENGYSPPISRSVVVGSRLFTISTSGVLSSDVVTLKPGTFAKLT